MPAEGIPTRGIVAQPRPGWHQERLQALVRHKDRAGPASVVPPDELTCWRKRSSSSAISARTAPAPSSLVLCLFRHARPPQLLERRVSARLRVELDARLRSACYQSCTVCVILMLRIDSSMCAFIKSAISRGRHGKEGEKGKEGCSDEEGRQEDERQKEEIAGATFLPRCLQPYRQSQAS